MAANTGPSLRRAVGHSSTASSQRTACSAAGIADQAAPR